MVKSVQGEREAEAQAIENQIEIAMMLKTGKVEMTGIMTKIAEMTEIMTKNAKEVEVEIVVREIMIKIVDEVEVEIAMIETMKKIAEEVEVEIVIEMMIDVPGRNHHQEKENLKKVMSK